MKKTTRPLSFLLIFFGILFFFYGLVKMSNSEKESNREVSLGDGITLVEEKPSDKLSNIGFIAGLVLVVVGGIVYAASKK